MKSQFTITQLKKKIRVYVLVNIVLGSVLTGLNAQAQNQTAFDVARNGTVSAMEQLYKKNPDIINSVDEKKSSPLILAAYRGNTDVALFLADKVKDVNYNSGMGTALMAAIMSGNLAVVDKLIKAKANLDLADQGGKTALIYATFFNKNDLAKRLLEAGANRNIKDVDGRNALDYATFNKNTELIILLQK